MMKEINLNSICLSLIAVLCLTGCLASHVPPYTREDIISDDKIIGRWVPVKPKTGGKPPFYTVVPSGDKLYELHIKEDGKETSAQMTLFKLDGQMYLSLSYSDNEQLDTVQYYWEQDALKIKGLNQKKFDELLKNENLDVGMSTDQLRSFLKQYGVQVFTEESMELRRLGE